MKILNFGEKGTFYIYILNLLIAFCRKVWRENCTFIYVILCYSFSPCYSQWNFVFTFSFPLLSLAIDAYCKTFCDTLYEECYIKWNCIVFMTSIIIMVYQCFHYKLLLLRALKLTHKNSLRTVAGSTMDKQIPFGYFWVRISKIKNEI